MSRIKTQILKKLKEYASKMGTNTMGGDDYTSKKRGGLRDFDGYDNVDYNKDMPMDEVSSADAYKISRMLGTAQQSTQDFIDDNKIDVKKIESYIKRLSPAKKVIIKDIINGSTDNRLSTIKKNLIKQVKESLDEACWKGYKEVDGKIKNGTQVPNCVPESVVQEAKVETERFFGKKGIIIMIRDGGKMVSAIFKDKKNADKYNRNKPADVKKLLQLAKKTKYPKAIDESIDESMFSMIDQIRQDSKNVRDFVKNVFKDREFKKMSNDKEFIKYLKSIYEGIEENFPSNWMQGRTSDYHTSLRGKKKDYSGGANFKKNNSGQPDIEDEIEESGKEKSEKNYKDWKNTNEGFDKIEHLKLLNKAMRTMPGSPKQKDIIRKLNVVRKAGGMRPLKERTKTDSNSKGYKEATKLIAKLRSTTFKKFNDDELEQFRAALAFSFDLKEYASKLTLSYIADKDSKLDGTPEDIKAIDEKAERDYKDEYKKFQSSKKSKKYRAELNKYNRDKGTYGNGDGKDASHKGGKIVGFESASKNRGRAEKSRLKKNK